MVLDEMEVVMTGPAQSIGELVEPLAIAAGLELWDVEVNPRMVRVLVDRDGGVDLDSLAHLARAVSAALDGRDELTPGTQYQLEVSSPGVERTLRRPGHYQRYVGTTISVKTTTPVAGSRRLQGVLLAADGNGITLEGPQGAVELRYDQIQKARTVVVWEPSKARTRPTPVKGAAR
jgi:ribosome maturation factor RimP